MGIRNSEELGSNLLLIAKRLLENKNLCKLLVNTDKNPLDKEVKDNLALLHNNLLVVPIVDESDFNAESKIVVLYPGGMVNSENDEFKIISVDVMIYTPFVSWIINSENLRPFLIMSEIEKSLKSKRINGIGIMKYNGFELVTITNHLACYKMSFDIDVFN